MLYYLFDVFEYMGNNEIVSKYLFSVRQVETTDVIHLYLSDVDVNTRYLRIKF